MMKKINKWLAAPAAALLLMTGSSAYADSMTLAGGEVMDMGAAVSVYPGERSFFGSQFHDWLMKPDVTESMEKALESTSIFPKDKGFEKEFSEMAVSILRSGKVYQVRSVANGTYYQGMVVSLAVSDADMLKISVYKDMKDEKAEAAKKDNKAGKDDIFDEANALFHGTVSVDDHSKWKEGKSSEGVMYRTGDARISLNKNGFLLPLYVRGIITRGEGKTVYTVFIADQASGKYFSPLFEKALKGTKK